VLYNERTTASATRSHVLRCAAAALKLLLRLTNSSGFTYVSMHINSSSRKRSSLLVAFVVIT
jgi:hypothetical protein